MSDGLWSVPKLWRGDPAFILGGGPSLQGVDVLALRRKGRILAINLAFRLDRWADCVFANDRKWFFQFGEELQETYRGGLVVTTSNAPGGGLPLRKLKPTSKWPLSTHPQMLAGWDGGSRSINLAYLLGANPIVLLGFDMRPGAWHDGYGVPSEPSAYRKYQGFHDGMAPWLAREGVTVWNCSPGTVLGCYPVRDILSVTGELDWQRPLGTSYRNRKN